jgi:hypothetical protein
MQAVSENWKNAHKQSLLNESYVEVSLNITDPEARADASSQDNGAVYISDTPQVVGEVDKTITPYCTLEQNLWLLDGGRKAIPESNFGDSGYVGDVLSDEFCVFSSKTPILTIRFSKVFENLIPGVTITWSPTYGEFADSFVVIAYNGTAVVAEREVIGNRSTKSLVMMDIIGYDRIEIVVKKWCLPYHRARIEEVFVGINKVYSKTDLFDYSHKQFVDPVSTALPKAEIRFSIDNVDGDYNPYNNQGMAKYLKERQEVKARYGLKMNDGSVEWIKGGTFFLSEWYAKQNGLTADFTARDLLEFMSDIYEDKVVVLSTRTLYELAEKVLQAANLPLNDDGTVRWYIDESLKSITTVSQMPPDTIANCLQLIANAGECVLYQDRDGILRIEPLKFDVTDYKINSFNSYTKSEITTSKPLCMVRVKVYDYQTSSDGIKSTTWYTGAVINSTGEIIELDNPLITDRDRAIAVGTWVGTHLAHRLTLDSAWRADVRLDALDIVTNENNYNTNSVRMTDVEFKFNGAFRGTGKGKVV